MGEESISIVTHYNLYMTTFGKTISTLIFVIIVIVALWLVSQKPAVAPVQSTETEQTTPSETTPVVETTTQTDDATLTADMNAIDAELEGLNAEASAAVSTE